MGAAIVVHNGFSWPLWTAFHSSTRSVLREFPITPVTIVCGPHKAWDAHWSVRSSIALGGALALQKTVFCIGPLWVSDHREHHKHGDHEDKDPICNYPWVLVCAHWLECVA